MGNLNERLSDRTFEGTEVRFLEMRGTGITGKWLFEIRALEEAGGEPHDIPAGQWPRELTAYADCLEPHLKAVVMAPSPADGSYEPVYTFPGNPAGQTAH